MLVLSRKLNEEIVIGGDVRVRIVHVGEGKVRIGIEAPATVGIRRGELADRGELAEPAVAPVATPSFVNERPVPTAPAMTGSRPVRTSSGRFVLPLLDLNRLPSLRRPR